MMSLQILGWILFSVPFLIMGYLVYKWCGGWKWVLLVFGGAALLLIWIIFSVQLIHNN